MGEHALDRLLPDQPGRPLDHTVRHRCSPLDRRRRRLRQLSTWRRLDRVAHMADLVIRNGTVVDGTGAPPFVADVAITDGVITAVGDGRRAAATARSTPTACSSRPGFVDIHTHFDGQATWDPIARPVVACTASPSIVMGNCGVGFAPARARPPRLADRPARGRRGHPRHRAGRGPDRGTGRPSPSTSTRSTRTPYTVDVGAHVPARRAAHLRDGRAGRRPHRGARPTTSSPTMAAPGRARRSTPARSASPPSRTDVHRTSDGEQHRHAHLGRATSCSRSPGRCAEPAPASSS